MREQRDRRAPLTVASLLAAITGILFGLPGCYAVWHLARHGQDWTFLGYPIYGAGPFEDLGIRTTTAALAPSGS